MYLRMPAWQLVMLIGFFILVSGITAGVVLAIILGVLILFGSMFLMDYEERLKREDQRKRKEEARKAREARDKVQKENKK